MDVHTYRWFREGGSIVPALIRVDTVAPPWWMPMDGETKVRVAMQNEQYCQCHYRAHGLELQSYVAVVRGWTVEYIEVPRVERAEYIHIPQE